MTLERQTYYDLLGVDYDATHEEIRNAYERMLVSYENNPEMQKQIKLGWAALRNPRSRAAYDKRNDIARLRQVRQKLDRPPPTLVGEELEIPHTIVGDEIDLSIPRTIIAAGSDTDTSSQPSDADSIPALRKLVVTLSVQPLLGKPWSREVSVGEYIVGRQDENGEGICDICLQDPDRFISRKHATLLVRHEGCFVRDEHSDNGTYVNGHLLPPGQIAMLTHNDQISIEGQILTIDIRQEPEHQ